MKSLLFFFLILLAHSVYSQGIDIKLPIGTIIKEAPDIYSKLVEIITMDKQARLIEKVSDEFWKIRYFDKELYVNERYLLNISEDFQKRFIDSIKNVFSAKQINVGIEQKKKRVSQKLKLQRERDSLLIDFKKILNLKTKATDIKLLTDKFFSTPEKDEFESTSDFKKRTMLDTSKIYYFDYLLSSSNAGIQYDADKETFKHSSELLIGEQIESKFHKVKTYIGSNSIGEKQKITVYQDTRYKVRAIEQLWNLKNSKGVLFGDGELTIAIAKEKAKNAKYTLTGRIGVTYANYFDRMHSKEIIEATNSIPNEINFDTYFLIGKIRFIVFYNNLTKEIYDVYLP